MLSHASLASLETEVIRSSNSLKPQEPQRLSLNGAGGSTTINPGESVEVPAIFHAEILGDHELCLLFVFREVSVMERFSKCIFASSPCCIGRFAAISHNHVDTVL